MACAVYGVVVTAFLHGRIKQTYLVLGPKINFPHLINSGDAEFAEAPCNKMREAGEKPYSYRGQHLQRRPLPVTKEGVNDVVANWTGISRWAVGPRLAPHHRE
jgi:hypothetical protein